MKLSPEVVRERLQRLRELDDEYMRIERYERRLRDLRALDDLARFLIRARREAGLATRR